MPPTTHISKKHHHDRQWRNDGTLPDYDLWYHDSHAFSSPYPGSEEAKDLNPNRVVRWYIISYSPDAHHAMCLQETNRPLLNRPHVDILPQRYTG